MLKKVVSAVVSKLFSNHAGIPAEYLEELETERLNINIKREKVLSFLLVLIASVLLLGDLSVLNIAWGDMKKRWIHLLLIIFPLIFLIGIKVKEKFKFVSRRFLNCFHLCLNTCVLTSCAFIALINRVSWEEPFSFVVAIFCIASVLLLSQRESVIIFITSYSIYIAGILFLHVAEVNKLSNDTFILLLVAAAFVISRVNYTAFVKNYVNDRIINNKNRELDRLNHITEEALEKRTEELNKAVEYDKLRTNFFANISHELRTPLTVIFSAQQMLDMISKKSSAGGEEEDNLKRYSAIIKQNCYRLLRLISNLIDMTKLNAGCMKPSLGNYNIVKFVKDISFSIEKFIESMGLKMTFETEIEEAVIPFDFEMIERIILNLLSNAVKYTPKGGSIMVKISGNADMVYISVKDTGIGIAEHMQTLIFERFVRADPTNTREREGSGIGLSLVKSLVDLHNGIITLRSKEGLGTELVIGLPRAAAPVDAVRNIYSGEKNNIEKINIEFSDIYP